MGAIVTTGGELTNPWFTEYKPWGRPLFGVGVREDDGEGSATGSLSISPIKYNIIKLFNTMNDKISHD